MPCHHTISREDHALSRECSFNLLEKIEKTINLWASQKKQST